MANLSSAFRLFSLAALFVLLSSHFWDFLSEDLEKKKKKNNHFFHKQSLGQSRFKVS